MSKFEEVMLQLKSKSVPENLAGMAKFGMAIEQRLGVSIPETRRIARSTGKDHELAQLLWRSGIADARILASMIDVPGQVSEIQMEEWVKDFNSWDVCDQVCMNLFDKVPFVARKVFEWSDRNEEFVKRAAFALIACLAWHDKKAGNEQFVAFLPVIVKGSVDERNYVKKAVNWALRHIGKRNLELNKAALETALQIRNIESRAAKWIASDAIRELESDNVQKRLAGK